MKRKRYTEDLEFKISDEEADDADTAGRDSPSNTSQSEQQVSSPSVWSSRALEKVGWRVHSWKPWTPSRRTFIHCRLTCYGIVAVQQCLSESPGC